MSHLYRITLHGGPRDGEQFESRFPIEPGETFVGPAGHTGARYVALGEAELGPDGKLDINVYWEPPSRDRAPKLAENIVAAVFVGLSIGLGLGLGLLILHALGELAGLASVIAGGWSNLIIYLTLAGPVVIGIWALADPRVITSKGHQE